MESSLELSLAKKYIEEYAAHDDAVMRDHYEAEECVRCERALQAGIKAFKWLRRADEAIREAANANISIDPQLPQLIERLYRLWLQLHEPTERRIAMSEGRDYRLDHAAEYRDRARDVAQIVERYDRLKALSERIPSAEELDLLAIDPRQWLSDPSWIK